MMVLTFRIGQEIPEAAFTAKPCLALDVLTFYPYRGLCNGKHLFLLITLSGYLLGKF